MQMQFAIVHPLSKSVSQSVSTLVILVSINGCMADHQPFEGA